jgi:lipoate-protein ligase A
MKLIISESNSCYLNIASEEYLMSNFADDIFYLYTNSPSIIVGCHQNTYAEINHDFVERNGIAVVRRRSGGGAVYHDFGNLNYGFIFSNTGRDIDSIFKEFTKPILSALHNLGVHAEFSGRNDLTIDGAKFSGTAQWHRAGRGLIHGTLLFDSDLTMLSKALNASELKFQDKGVKSVRSRVTNIRPHLERDLDPDSFRQAIVDHVVDYFKNLEIYEYSEADIQNIQKLADERYQARAWNYGNSPDFSYSHSFRYEKGTLEICVNSSGGMVGDVCFYGDFFGVNPDISILVNAIIGAEYSRQGIALAIEGLEISDFIAGLSKEQFLSGFFAVD